MRYENRRQFIRLRAYHLAKYRPLSDQKGAEGSSPIIATIRDIGAGGVCLKTDNYLPVSTLLELNINFPNVSTSVFALAKVVWIKPIKKTKSYEIGAQFVQITDSVRLIIDEQIRRVYQRLKKDLE